MLITTWNEYARKRIPGPYTKPFQPSAIIENAIPAIVAFAIKIGLLFQVSLMPAIIYSGFALVDLNTFLY